MNGLVPPGCRAVLIGAAASIEDMDAFTPMEEGTAEGSLMLMRLDFVDFPTGKALDKLNKALRDAGVPSWPGYDFIVYADTNQPSVYLTWQKGIAWIPIIIVLLASVALPPLLGSLVWLILPEEIKSLITGLISMGMMLLVMFVMMQLMKPLTAPEKPKKVRAAPGKDRA
jgi:hypothetical protein